jgi:DNA-binding NtrC family response regulator
VPADAAHVANLSKQALERTALIVEQDCQQRLAFASALVSENWLVRTTALGARSLAVAAWFEPSVVVIDATLTDILPIDLVHLLRERLPHALLIATMPPGQLDSLGACSELDGVLEKPIERARLVGIIELLVHAQQLHRLNAAG